MPVAASPPIAMGHRGFAAGSVLTISPVLSERTSAMPATSHNVATIIRRSKESGSTSASFAQSPISSAAGGMSGAA